MDFDSFIGKGWDDHVADPRGVAMRLGDGLALIVDEAQVPRWTGLAVHVWGEHLGDWQAGIDALQDVTRIAVYRPEGASGQAWRRSCASLALAAGDGTMAEALPLSDRIRAVAMAASSLVAHDPLRAGSLLDAALSLAERSGLAGDDPMNRALAVTGNSMACALEEKADRSAAERELMLLAARTARHYWGRAGTWLEVERAEYRLAQSCLQAGDLALARDHAQACLGIVEANQGAALERLFAWEALGLVEKAAGNSSGHVQALEKAREAFDMLADADKAWCAASVDKLAA